MDSFVISAGLTPTAGELAMMTPEERARHATNAARNVFGADVQFDKQGRPIERGIGSAAQPTANHIRALEKAEGVEAALIAKQAAAQRGQT
jgi:hypothetical protein